MEKREGLPPDPGQQWLRREFEAMLGKLEQQRDDLAWLIARKEGARSPMGASPTSPPPEAPDAGTEKEQGARE